MYCDWSFYSNMDKNAWPRVILYLFQLRYKINMKQISMLSFWRRQRLSIKAYIMTFTLSIVADRWCMGEGEVCYLALSVALINEWEVTETISFILPLLRKVFPLIFFFTCWHIWSGYPKAHPVPANLPPPPNRIFCKVCFCKTWLHILNCSQHVYNMYI